MAITVWVWVFYPIIVSDPTPPGTGKHFNCIGNFAMPFFWLAQEILGRIPFPRNLEPLKFVKSPMDINSRRYARYGLNGRISVWLFAAQLLDRFLFFPLSFHSCLRNTVAFFSSIKVLCPIYLPVITLIFYFYCLAGNWLIRRENSLHISWWNVGGPPESINTWGGAPGNSCFHFPFFPTIPKRA